MDKESVLQKRNRAEHSSLLIVSAGFLLLCTCEVFGIITGKLWIGQREIVFGGTLFLKNNLKEARAKKQISQRELAEMVGVSRNTISSIETGQFNPTAKLALIICIALDKKFEELFYF